MAYTYEQAQQRALQINYDLKHSQFFARPIMDKSTLQGWKIEVVDTVKLVKQHEKRKFHF